MGCTNGEQLCREIGISESGLPGPAYTRVPNVGTWEEKRWSYARTGAFSFRVDSDIEGDLDRSQAVRHFLIDGAVVEGSTLKCRAITCTAKWARDL